LQVPAATTVSVAHVAWLQVVPEAYCSQLPLPSQRPSRLQLGAPSSGQAPFEAPCAGMGVQVPAEAGAGRAQERQAPLHALAQQTPCSQKPEAHWAALVQPAARSFLRQTPPMQVLGAVQWASVVHVVRQTLLAVSH
jgi:hypothetical protein